MVDNTQSLQLNKYFRSYINNDIIADTFRQLIEESTCNSFLNYINDFRLIFVFNRGTI